MTNTPDSVSSASVPHPELSDDLPPVQPPSAGFIVQLFVVPGMIVAAVVLVWFAFGQIAAVEQDWRSLVEELQSPNGHIRKLAMYGLLQVLEQDRRRGAEGKHLSSNREIATSLAEQLTRELKANSSSSDSLSFQEYLTRAVGLLDVPEVTMPPLRQALEPTRDIEIRKSGVASIALIAGRALEKQAPLNDPETVDALVQLSADSLPLMRQTAAFALGLFEAEAAQQQLRVLLANSDWKTCVNAAIALSRHDKTDGLGVFKQALTAKPPEKAEEQAEYSMIVANSLRAITHLAPKMSESERAEFREILKPMVNDHADLRVRLDAQNALLSLK